MKRIYFVFLSAIALLVSFSGCVMAQSVSGNIGGHDYVDLDLSAD